MAKNQPVKQQPEAAAVIDTNVYGELAGESPEHLASPVNNDGRGLNPRGSSLRAVLAGLRPSAMTGVD